MDYKAISEFNKDFKKLNKKYKTLPKDLDIAKKAAIELFHINKIDNGSVVAIPGYCFNSCKSYKMRKFSCMSLRGRGNQTGIRIIYVYHEESQTVTFIEIYHKNTKANEDKERLDNFFKELE